jgi:hypothetical protein
MLEEEHILAILLKNVDEILNKEEGPSTLVMSKVSTLCEDLIEDDGIPLELDDQLEHLKPVVKEKELGRRKHMTLIVLAKVLGRELKSSFYNAESKRHELESKGFWGYCKAFACHRGH